MNASPPLVILGCGYTGAEAARLAMAEGARVVATVRAPERAAALEARGIPARVIERLTAEHVEGLVTEGARVLIAFPPDGATDAAVALGLARASAAVYLSSTAVYGGASGPIDEDTPVAPEAPRAGARLAAEQAYRDRGASILRAAAIYGPGRGLHVRLARGEHLLTEDGRNVISRIHVTDLARLALAALSRAAPGSIFNVADDAPVPQIEVIEWLCARLGVPVPPAAPRASVHETLRQDRAIQNHRVKRALGLSLLYPTYREGFEACLASP